MRPPIIIMVATLLFGCDALGLPALDLERMIDQRRVEAYEASPYFSDGRGMRTPPRGTVPHGNVPSRGFESGRENGRYLTTIPVPITRETLARGRERYDVFCAACHGVVGTARTQVAENMTIRKPPSLVAEPIRSYPAGRIFQVLSTGYGVMPSYASGLGLTDGWKVVAYVRALQLSRGVSLEELPPQIRSEAVSMLP